MQYVTIRQYRSPGDKSFTVVSISVFHKSFHFVSWDSGGWQGKASAQEIALPAGALG